MRDAPNPRIQQLLAPRGASEAAAKAIDGVDKTQLSRLKNGKTANVAMGTWKALADHFGVRFEWLAIGEGSMTTGASVSGSNSPADRARAAALALGFHQESIERGLAQIEDDDTAWGILTKIQNAESKRPRIRETTMGSTATGEPDAEPKGHAAAVERTMREVAKKPGKKKGEGG